MITPDTLKKIISDGVRAPSGENCQPWKFEFRNGTLFIYNIPEADKSLYNTNQMGSYVAHGALIENLIISSASNGYKAEVSIFPESSDFNLVSSVQFKPDSSFQDPLYKFIKNRCTNRRDYSGKKLTLDEKQELFVESQKNLGGKLILEDNELNLKKLGDALAINEKILFENKSLHKFFYDHILWNESDQNKSGGFYIKTLELHPHQLKGIKLFKNWIILKILNKVAGASKIIVKENSEKYSKSGTLGIIYVENNKPSDFIAAGRILQRVWLTATKLGLSLHPCTGVLYFMERIRAGKSSDFSNEHLQLIKNAYSNIEEVFKVSNKTIPMLFRLGHAEPPTARSQRLPVKVNFK